MSHGNKVSLDWLSEQYKGKDVDLNQAITHQTISDVPYSAIIVSPEKNSGNIEKIYEEKEFWLEKLALNGAILFRGFNMDSVAAVERFANHFMASVFKENTEHTPLENSDFVQQPVGYSNDSFLLWHNENTFNLRWPAKAVFACKIPAQSGGETPIVDSRIVYLNIDPAIREEFERKGVRYVRRYGAEDGIGLGWKTIFKTSDKNEIERICEQDKLIFHWFPNGDLVTFADRPAVYTVEETGEKCWINQAQHWHFSCLSESTQAAIKKIYSSQDEYPRNCFFGDGTEIPNSYIDHVLDVYKQHQQVFPWQKGDIMLVDNKLKAHARNAYKGERKIMVCFGEMESF